jgi:glycerol uptake operon antiterminator
MPDIREVLYDSPIIGAVRDVKNIDRALKSGLRVIFMLCGSILNIEEIISRIKATGKLVCVHIDLVEGLGRDSAAVEFLKKVGADGIITTKPSLIKDARACGIFAIQRLFMLDSRSLESGIKCIREDHPDAVEIMPGIAAKVIGSIHQRVDILVIAGGLILDKSDIIDALSKGAVAVSTTDTTLWEE